MNRFNRVHLIFGFIVVFIIILIVSYLLTSRQKALKYPPPIPIAPTSKPTVIKVPPETKDVPTLPPSKGVGYDLGSPVIKNSKNEIDKLVDYLPYQTKLNLSSGQIVDVVIPGKEYFNNPWVLTIQVFGIEYELSPSDPSYVVNRQTFREAASTIFDWIRSKGVSPEVIVISWGDRAFIQERAEEWLRSP